MVLSVIVETSWMDLRFQLWYDISGAFQPSIQPLPVLACVYTAAPRHASAGPSCCTQAQCARVSAWARRGQAVKGTNYQALL